MAAAVRILVALLVLLLWPLHASACGDVDVDGDFDVDDRTLYRGFLAGLTDLSPGGFAQCTVVGSTRPCDLLNLTVMERNLAAPPLTPSINDACDDGDRDGVTDSADLCPGSPPGASDLGEGCSALDALLRPGELLEAPTRELASASLLLHSPELASNAAVGNLTGALDAVLAEIPNVEAQLRNGDPCAAASLWSALVGTLDGERSALEAVVSSVRADVYAVPDPVNDPHFGDGFLAAVPLELGLAEVDRMLASAGTQTGILDGACSAVVSPMPPVVARVANVDDAARLLTLDTGQQFGLSLMALSGDYGRDQLVTVTGIGLGAGMGFAQDVAPADPPDPASTQAACLFLRVAPVQAFPPYATEPVTLHSPKGYELLSTGTLSLERGSGFGLLTGFCPGSQAQFALPWTRYSARLRVEYPAGNYLPVATDLRPGELAFLPPGLPDGVDATLHFDVRKQSCLVVLGGTQCGLFQEVRSQTWPLRVYARGSLCTAQYWEDQLDLEDNDTTTFRVTYVDNMFVNSTVVESATGAGFEGTGCIALSGATSCDSGTLVPVGANQSFRIYNHDFYPIHPGIGIGGIIQGILARRAHGVTHAAGLRWPRVKGIRNAGSYWYSCELPDLVRDVVDYCPNELEDTFYRYPWYPTIISTDPPRKWFQGKGNVGQNPGHGGLQNFAFDFDPLAPCPWPPNGMCVGGYDPNNPHGIRAARGGRVVLMRESSNTKDDACWAAQSMTSTDLGCDMGNYLFIRHEDGSYGVYFHMVQNGVLVNMGEHVLRSRDVGLAGTTGASAAPHLHFHVQTSNGIDTSASIRVRFQTQVNTCHIPPNGDELPSSNDPSQFW